MMKKQTLIAVVVFVGLLVIGIISVTGERERGISRIDFSALATDGIDKIQISGKNEAELIKSGDDWQLDGKLVDARAVKQLIDAIPKLVSSDMVTKTRARYADLEVDDEKGTGVKVFAGSDVIAEFRVGKAARGGSHILIGEEVYAVSGVYPRTFAKNGNNWLEKKLFKDNFTDVEKVEVKLNGKAPYVLIKKDGKWDLEDASILPKDFRFDKAAASRVVSSLIGLRAKEILDEDPGVEKTKLDAGYDAISYFTKADGSGNSGTVRIGATDTEKKATYVQVEGRGEVMTVYESTVNNLRKLPTDLRDMKMVELDKAKVNSLVILSDGKKLTLDKKGSDWSIGTSSDKVPADFTLDPAAVSRRLSAFQNARAMSVATLSAGAAGLGRPSASITATLEDGKKVTLAFGKKTKQDNRDVVYARGNADNAVYVVNAYTRKNVTGLLDTFKKRENIGGPSGLGNIDPSALKNLPPDVRKSLEQQMRQQAQQQKMLKRLQARAK